MTNRQDNSVTRQPTPVSFSLWPGNIAVNWRADPYAVTILIPDNTSLVRMLWAVNTTDLATAPFENFTERWIADFSNIYSVEFLGDSEEVGYILRDSLYIIIIQPVQV